MSTWHPPVDNHFILTGGYTLESTPESSVLKIQRTNNQEMSGEVAGGSNCVIGAEAATVMATQPDNVADEQE